MRSGPRSASDRCVAATHDRGQDRSSTSDFSHRCRAATPPRPQPEHWRVGKICISMVASARQPGPGEGVSRKEAKWLWPGGGSHLQPRSFATSRRAAFGHRSVSTTDHRQLPDRRGRPAPGRPHLARRHTASLDGRQRSSIRPWNGIWRYRRLGVDEPVARHRSRRGAAGGGRSKRPFDRRPDRSIDPARSGRDAPYDRP